MENSVPSPPTSSEGPPEPWANLVGAKVAITVPIRADTDLLAARYQARTKAGTLGFSHIEATLIATATSELARNILAHARRGEIILLIVEQKARRGIVVVARDEGPGIPDIAQAMKEGFSTIRSLGRGLSGVRRLMDELEIVSEVDRGTTVIAKKWKSR
jgi:serine/threonine-protein kinase RsbT